MIEVNFIVTVYNSEDYWIHLKKILDDYTKIKSNYVVCYSGERDNFDCDFRVENKMNGGRGLDHHQSACLWADMDFILTIGGYNLLKNNGVNKWVKLSIDSWLLDEEKIIQIFEFLEKEDCVYGGNVWYTHQCISTDIFFVNTKEKNIFEDLSTHGNIFLDYLYYKKIPLGFEYLMKNIITPHNYGIILGREPILSDSTRWFCTELGWCMFHQLEKNLDFLNNFVPNRRVTEMKKVLGSGIEYNFVEFLKVNGYHEDIPKYTT